MASYKDFWTVPLLRVIVARARDERTRHWWPPPDHGRRILKLHQEAIAPSDRSRFPDAAGNLEAGTALSESVHPP